MGRTLTATFTLVSDIFPGGSRRVPWPAARRSGERDSQSSFHTEGKHARARARARTPPPLPREAAGESLSVSQGSGGSSGPPRGLPLSGAAKRESATPSSISGRWERRAPRKSRRQPTRPGRADWRRGRGGASLVSPAGTTSPAALFPSPAAAFSSPSQPPSSSPCGGGSGPCLRLSAQDLLRFQSQTDVGKRRR